MQTVFYVLASVAAVLVIVAVPILAMRVWMLIVRLDDTRRELASLIAESTFTLQHANRVLVSSQEELDRLRHAVEGIERVLGALAPATVVGGFLAGARRALTGRRESPEPPAGEGGRT